MHQDFPKQCFCCPNMETLHHFALRRSFFAVEFPSMGACGCTRFVCTVCNGDLLMSSCFIVLTRSKSKCSFVSQCPFINIKRFAALIRSGDSDWWKYFLLNCSSVHLDSIWFRDTFMSGHRSRLTNEICCKARSRFCHCFVFSFKRGAHIYLTWS